MPVQKLDKRNVELAAPRSVLIHPLPHSSFPHNKFPTKNYLYLRCSGTILTRKPYELCEKVMFHITRTLNF